MVLYHKRDVIMTANLVFTYLYTYENVFVYLFLTSAFLVFCVGSTRGVYDVVRNGRKMLGDNISKQNTTFNVEKTCIFI